jgi:hypothetical protein
MSSIGALTLFAAAAFGAPQPLPLGGGATVVRAVALPEAPPFARLGPAPAILTGSGSRLRLTGWSVEAIDPQAPTPRPRVVPIY